MISELVKLCDERYQTQHCESCTYGTNCPRSCETCLEYIHFPQRAPVERKNDCQRMMDFYVCKYAHKYTSELIYAFSLLKDLKVKRHLKVLSIGCGPCTDLLALDYLVRAGEYGFVTLDYQGVEINTEIWNNIYDNIYDLKPQSWSFEVIPRDICDYIDTLLRQDWKPDLIVLQYVFSDMRKHTPSQTITTMIDSLALFIDSCEKNTYIVCNDINLSIDRGGGREYFDRLYRKMSTRTTPHRYHFNNINKSNHFDYGDEYGSNDLIVVPGDNLDDYQPYKSCASAQMIIKKEE